MSPADMDQTDGSSAYGDGLQAALDGVGTATGHAFLASDYVAVEELERVRDLLRALCQRDLIQGARPSTQEAKPEARPPASSAATNGSRAVPLSHRRRPINRQVHGRTPCKTLGEEQLRILAAVYPKGMKRDQLEAMLPKRLELIGSDLDVYECERRKKKGKRNPRWLQRTRAIRSKMRVQLHYVDVDGDHVRITPAGLDIVRKASQASLAEWL
jgi:hypothetical protein